MDFFRYLALIALAIAAGTVLLWLTVLAFRRTGAGNDVVLGIAALAFAVAAASYLVDRWITFRSAPARIVLNTFVPSSADVADDAGLMAAAVEAHMRDIYALLSPPLEPWRQWREPATPRLLARITEDLLATVRTEEPPLIQTAEISTGPIGFNFAARLPRIRRRDEIISGVVSSGDGDRLSVDVAGTVDERSFAVRITAPGADEAAALIAAAIYAHSADLEVRGQDAAEFVLAVGDHRRAVRFGTEDALKRAHDRIHGLTDRRPNWPEAGLLAAAIFTEVASRRMPETEQKTKGALDEDEYRAEILRTALPHLLSFEGTDPDLSRLVDLMALNTLIRVVQYPDRRESIRLAFERRARQMHKTWTKRQEAAQKEDAKGAKGSDQKDSDGPPMEELEAAALARATLLGALGPKKGPDCAPDERVEAFFGSIENATDRFPELILFYRVSGLYCRLLAALSTDPKNMIALKEVRDALGGIIAQRRATLSDARLGHNELRLHWTALAAERALELRARIALGEKEEELRYALLDAISEAERMDRGLQARPGGWMRAHLATLQIEASLDFADRAQDHPEKAKDLLRDAAAYGADAARTLGLPASVTDVTAEWEADSTIRTEIVRLLASQWPVARDQPLGDLWIIARALLASSDLPPEDAGKLWSPVDPEEIRRKLCEDLAPGARNRLLSPTPRLADEIGPLLNSLKC